jgi:hypothetical protein
VFLGVHCAFLQQGEGQIPMRGGELEVLCHTRISLRIVCCNGYAIKIVFAFRDVSREV